MIKRKTFLVSGRVQGVFFRKYTQAEALRLGLQGFVQNQPDGTVYLEAQGENDLLNQLENWLYKGSPLSHVMDVKVEVIALSDAESGFRIQ